MGRWSGAASVCSTVTSKTVGETYGDYDLATLKAKLDLVAFGIETPA